MDWVPIDLPDMPFPRFYHSTAILLPDARILLGGGRVYKGGDVEDDTERRFSIFKPGYLIDGDQPVIENAPDEITYEEVFEMKLDGTYDIDSFALLKPGAVTHGSDMDQLYIELYFERIIGTGPSTSGHCPN